MDHRDRKRENNKIENLRASDHSGNSRNRPALRNGKSKYKGVSPTSETHKKPWCANISYEGKKQWLGSFDTEEEAALAYNEKCKELHGDHALLNVIDKEVA